ncbi:hypothetical protein [Polaromonas sp. YR568]|uniref:hypothetical protein n=1 Tax=Polaromonas sp. YR568 TaxID=1855301 RepID=UPI000B8417AE|nr:hypothetical protein [Polaromonas sp. YR568]
MVTLGSRLRFVVSAFIVVALVGGVTFICVLFALRPYSLAGIFNITSPEVWLAAGLATTAMVVCVWRLARGSSAHEEFELLADAALKNDHLG